MPTGRGAGTCLLAVCALTALSAGASAGEAWQPVGLCGGGAMFAMAGSPLDRDVMMLSCDMSAAYVSRDGGRSWRMIHHAMLSACTTCAPAFHPKIRGRIYAMNGWRGHVRVSTDDGRTWKNHSDGRPWRRRVTLLYVDPDYSERMFVGTLAALFLTRDDGKNWRKCPGVAGRALGLATDRNSPRNKRTYVLGTDRGVFRSDDNGKTWRASRAGLADTALLSFAGGSSRKLTRLYATVPCKVVRGRLAGGIYVSKDVGRSWQRCMNPKINVRTRRSSKWANGDIPAYRFIVTTDRDPARAYVYCAGTSYFPPDHSTVYRTDDSGASWRATLFSDPRFKQYNCADDYLTLAIGQRWQAPPRTMAVSPADPDVVMLAGSMFLSRTDNGGRTWRVGHAIPAPKQKKDEPAWINNGLVVTTTWNYYIDPHRKRRHYIAYTDIGLARSLDAGETWIWQGHNLPWKNTTYELAFDPDVPGRIWGAFSNTHDIPNANVIANRHRVRMDGGIGVSDDYGKTWTAVKLPLAPALSVVLDPASPKGRRRLYASLFEKGVYRSDDGGKTWRKKSRGLGSPKNMRCCELVRHDDGTLFVLITAKRVGGRRGPFIRDGVGLYRSADSGENWSKISTSLPLYWPKDFTVHARDRNTILLSAADAYGHRDKQEGGLYRTTDGGKTWRKLARKGPEHFGAFYHPEKKGWIYMTLTEGAPGPGLWLSRDDGATWAPFSQLPFRNIQRVFFPPNNRKHIIVTTFGGSVFKGPIVPAESR